MKPKLKPYSDTRLVRFLGREISKLRGRKSQAAIAAEAGFRHANMLAMIKNGSSKLPLDRVPGLARALDCDAALLFHLALEQMSTDTRSAAINQIFRGDRYRERSSLARRDQGGVRSFRPRPHVEGTERHSHDLGEMNHEKGIS
jgi:hypothetical protein